MNWKALRAGFEDELVKIAETSLAGLSSDTLLNYPQPKSVPTEAFAKAQAILHKADQFRAIGFEKISNSIRPDEMPQFKKIFRKRRETDPPQTKLDKALSWGGHALAGAGTAKFVGGFAEKMKQHKTGKGFTPGMEAAIMAGGAGLGLLHKIRKDRRKKAWEQGHPA